MKNFIICLSLLFSSLMFAQENLIGKVIYNNNPVKGVIVQLRNYNTETISNNNF